MTIIQRCALLLTLLSLAACEQPANPPVLPKTPAVHVQPDSPMSTQTPPAPVSPAPQVEPFEAPKPVKNSAPAKPVAAPVKAKPAEPVPEKRAPLELSLRPDVFDPLQPLEPLNDLSTPLLPPLFVEKTEPESPFQLNGKLITNERGDDYWQSVEGAQLQFEFKQ
ncbi:hypothetical protein OU997_16890 [Pseudomonas sp. SL4(2022)]|uniref:hypothetical protein n=1 Tax=Pseudomonas sp. SL4(2022) TaxID=2994661 RepID=UPI00226D6317|nr:hypothetical protein [Pseudomonas sp. SL4(2022)]WAC43902.1 hypothetical protein OU997_16890 [Pseudomonas sp. SL4(2022)]